MATLNIKNLPDRLYKKLTERAKRETGMAGVANTGRDVNWSGHDFAQANWYAFGRLAWNRPLRLSKDYSIIKG